jgi:hypothetical protein
MGNDLKSWVATTTTTSTTTTSATIMTLISIVEILATSTLKKIFISNKVERKRYNKETYMTYMNDVICFPLLFHGVNKTLDSLA